MPVTILLVICAYLLGSIPNAVWIGKLFFGVDIRNQGSKNAGATNVFRTLGKKAGISVLILDILKGFFATQLIVFSSISPAMPDYANFQMLLAVAVMVGHIYPVFAGFKGGKGVASIFGAMLGVNAPAALMSGAVFMTCIIITRYVSVSSILGGITFPFIIYFIFNVTNAWFIFFSTIFATIIIVTHLKNIKRLLKKEEKKVTFCRTGKAEKNTE